MSKIITSVHSGAAMLGLSMTGSAQAEPDYPFAATGFFGGGGSWTSLNDCQGPSCDSDIATIVGGGDFVIPLHGYWNVQLGGAFYTSHQDFSFGGSETVTQFQGSAIGFWRDPAMGVFGIEFGVFSPLGNESRFQNSYKGGGVVEYFFSDMVTFGAFGGVRIPKDSTPFGNGEDIDTGYYAGGHLTYYASDTLAVAGYARFAELNVNFDNFTSPFSDSDRVIKVGGKVRHLISMPGVEVYASGGYVRCEAEFQQGGSSNLDYADGAEFMVGVKIWLGGHSDSLVSIDRSNAIDTRAWVCGISGAVL